MTFSQLRTLVRNYPKRVILNDGNVYCRKKHSSFKNVTSVGWMQYLPEDQDKRKQTLGMVKGRLHPLEYSRVVGCPYLIVCPNQNVEINYNII